MTRIQITDGIFAAFLRCRHKAYLMFRGERGQKSAYELSETERSSAYKVAAAGELRRLPELSVVDSPQSLAEDVRSRPDVILNATVCDADMAFRFDALEKIGDAESMISYRPIMFVQREKLTSNDRMQLGFGAFVFARVFGAMPATGKIIHGNEFVASRVDLASIFEKVRQALEELLPVCEDTKPPTLILNRHCRECEFRRRCHAAATERDDLSLLSGLSAKEIAGLNSRGIFTVTQYSYTFRPRRMQRAIESTGKRHDHSLQALAIREKTVFVALRPKTPDAPTRIHLDVEGLPDEGWYYLIGLTLDERSGRREMSFWADTKADEGRIWTSFLETVAKIGSFVLFYYGRYESHFIERMEARYGGDPNLLGRIKSNCVNVLSLVYSRVYFPAYGNGLKEVASCLGFRWSATEPCGLQAVAWRHIWEATGDESLKQDLLIYNQEDCLALEQVVQAMRLIDEEAAQLGQNGALPVMAAEEAPSPNRHEFGMTKVALPAFAHLTKCAYFDYQRDKVLCRTNALIKKITRKKQRPRRSVRKVNREVTIGRPGRCPYCGSDWFGQQSRHQKLQIDLTALRGGLRKRVTQYKAERCQCRRCLRTFLPEGFHALSKYGWGITAWIVYSSIALRQTNNALAEGLVELFDIDFSSGYISRNRHNAVERYRATYDALISGLRLGPLVHVDETKVAIKGSRRSAYVWVFARPDTAVYVYHPTRDGETVRKTLQGFRGVLISDFYSAYDSVECPQQKCLIHLMRDLNDDLLRRPFDEELKDQASRFAALLQAVVATIDRFGLRNYHLRKHKPDVDRFYLAVSGTVYKSERARHYQRRLVKYRDKLFTFLDHDEVPWNNNNAENAVKRFVSRRKAIGTPFTESGIRDYLVLLSVYQTLRYRNLSFWQFIFSGETDIDAFAAKHH